MSLQDCRSFPSELLGDLPQVSCIPPNDRQVSQFPAENISVTSSSTYQSRCASAARDVYDHDVGPLNPPLHRFDAVNIVNWLTDGQRE
jgi:hypothetical protein